METEDNKIHITVTIAQRVIDIRVNKEHEFYYREAEKRINDKFLQFAKKWAYTDHQDLLSKILLELMINYIAKEDKINAYEENLIPQMERLEDLSEEVRKCVAILEDTYVVDNATQQ